MSVACDTLRSLSCSLSCPTVMPAPCPRRVWGYLPLLTCGSLLKIPPCTHGKTPTWCIRRPEPVPWKFSRRPQARCNADTPNRKKLLSDMGSRLLLPWQQQKYKQRSIQRFLPCTPLTSNNIPSLAHPPSIWRLKVREPIVEGRARGVGVLSRR